MLPRRSLEDGVGDARAEAGLVDLRGPVVVQADDAAVADAEVDVADERHSDVVF
nr:MAG TPA: hypothetical protein [Caudoviricetes sp.]